ncbi:MAG TPA: hypothetical protein VFT56_08745, partial [Sphingomonas sp.]|nr:hypothetical protein [Sphingomonas sp.]
EGRWSNAVDMFKQSPLFGAGAVFKTGEVASPHNFWLYAFVEFGALSILFFGAFLSLTWKAAQRRPEPLLIASSFFILSMFNDRFVDLNLYPFAGFVILVMLATPRRPKAARARSSRLVKEGPIQMKIAA